MSDELAPRDPDEPPVEQRIVPSDEVTVDLPPAAATGQHAGIKVRLERTDRGTKISMRGPMASLDEAIGAGLEALMDAHPDEDDGHVCPECGERFWYEPRLASRCNRCLPAQLEDSDDVIDAEFSVSEEEE